MYSVEEIKELLSAFDASKATALDIQLSENEFISLRQKTAKPAAPAVCTTTVQTMPAVQEVQAAPAAAEQAAPVQDGTPIESPMVGVFYSAPSPDSDPYVTVGSTVKKGDVVCLIEARYA